MTGAFPASEIDKLSVKYPARCFFISIELALRIATKKHLETIDYQFAQQYSQNRSMRFAVWMRNQNIAVAAVFLSAAIRSTRNHHESWINRNTNFRHNLLNFSDFGTRNALNEIVVVTQTNSLLASQQLLQTSHHINHITISTISHCKKQKVKKKKTIKTKKTKKR